MQVFGHQHAFSENTNIMRLLFGSFAGQWDLDLFGAPRSSGRALLADLRGQAPCPFPHAARRLPFARAPASLAEGAGSGAVQWRGGCRSGTSLVLENSVLYLKRSQKHCIASLLLVASCS